MARVAAKHARRRADDRGPGRGRGRSVGAAGRPAGTVAGHVAGRLPTGARAGSTAVLVPTQPVRRTAPLVIDLTGDPPTATAAPAGPGRAPSFGGRLAATVLLLVGLTAAVSTAVVDLDTGARALAALVALWGVVVGGFALVRPATTSG